MRQITSLTAMMLSTMICLPAAADSLWSPSSRSLFADRKACAVGDIVTIVIVQQTTTSHNAAHGTSKMLDVEAGPGLGLLSFFPDLSLEAERSDSGTGTSTETTALTDRITAKVTAVMPNGTLRIEGTRSVTLKKDHLECVVRGLIRQEDVESDNTVLSSEVADLELVWTGKGPIDAKQRPGLISRLLDLLW
jgi:flagellar L-ring protein precursor FlgH